MLSIEARQLSDHIAIENTKFFPEFHGFLAIECEILI
jgi:hypothetical protein